MDEFNILFSECTGIYSFIRRLQVKKFVLHRVEVSVWHNEWTKERICVSKANVLYKFFGCDQKMPL